MSGWIKLHRSILTDGYMKDPPTYIMMSYALLKATHKQMKTNVRGDRVDLVPGQFIFGRNVASEETGLSPQQIRTAMGKLEKYQFLTIKATKRFSVVTVCKWAQYQSTECSDQPKDQPTGNQQVTNNQPTGNHVQEVKETKNDKTNTDPEIDLLLSGQPGWDEAWDGWKQHRTRMGKSHPTKRAKTLILNRLAERPGDAVRALDMCVDRGWKSFEWDWVDKQGDTKQGVLFK